MGVVRGLIRWLGTLTAAMLVSFILGGMLCFALGVAFDADLELLGAFGIFALATLATTAVLGLVAIAAPAVRRLDLAALGLVAAAALGLAVLIGGNALVRRDLDVLMGDLPILAETIVPIAAMVLIQWWFVRRRWRRENPDRSGEVHGR